MRIPFFAVTTAAVVFAGATALRAEPAPEQIDLSQFPAAAVQDVVVPVPSEIFNVLDKLGSPNWKGELRDSLGKQSGNRAQVALLLGTVIAEGFIAVEAEDSERVKEIGRDVLELSRAIGVEKAVVTRSKAIVDKADARDWNGTRRELDGALQDVRSAMNELNDEDLAQLVSLGGWVRGTEVLTSIVQKDYKPARAELLHQPELLNYFDRRLDDMSPRLRKSALVTQLKSMLEEIRPLILQGEGRKISPESVERIHTVTSKMVLTITATDA
jgi:flagellar biosynthesis regulator FlaF